MYVIFTDILKESICKIANMISQQRTVAKTLAMLLQRRMEILNQLETIVGKQSPQIKTVARKDLINRI